VKNEREEEEEKEEEGDHAIQRMTVYRERELTKENA